MPGDVSRNLPAAGLDDGEYETIRAAGRCAGPCMTCTARRRARRPALPMDTRMSYAGQIMEDYFRRTGKPGPSGLDAAYQYQVTVLRDLLERLEVVLEDEGVPREIVTRVIRHMLYGSPSVADAEMRMQQEQRIEDLMMRVQPLPVDVLTLPPKR